MQHPEVEQGLVPPPPPRPGEPQAGAQQFYIGDSDVESTDADDDLTEADIQNILAFQPQHSRSELVVVLAMQGESIHSSVHLLKYCAVDLQGDHIQKK